MTSRSLSRLAGVGLASVLAIATHQANADEQAWSSISPILDKHCARCHEDGKTKGKFKERPAGKFGFVLDEQEMIKHNKLIPGNADGSQIFAVIARGDMPKDTDDSCLDGSAGPDTYCGLTKEEKTALHDEINRLAAPAKTPQIVLAADRPPPALQQPKAPPKTAPQPEATPEPAAKPTAEAKVEPTPKPTTEAKAQPAPAPETKPEPAPEKAPPAEAKSPPTPAPTATAKVEAPTPSAEAPPMAEASVPEVHPFVTDRQIIRAISDDVAAAPPGDGASYRYLTLTHLVNAGDSEKDMRVYRLALTKLINSLSTDSDVYIPVPIDAAKTIFRLDIRRLGWTAQTWDAVVANDPYVIFYQDTQFKGLQRDLYTIAPFVHGDWFVFNASRPPLYNQILGLPHTRAELQAKLGMHVQRDFDDRRVERAGFQQSGVSSNNRLIERHSIATGAYWESYDFGSNEDRKSLFQFPLGPQGAFHNLSDRFGFRQDGGEIIFSLPNGFHAYYLTDGNGHQLDIGPTKIVRDPSQRDLAVTNGIACMGCHDKGMKTNEFRPGKPLDQIRDVVLRSGTFPAEVKDIVKEIYPPGPAFDKRLADDARRYAAALDSAGINVATHLDGVEIINALSKRFEENMNARLAAAEVGMTEDAFMERLNAAGQQAYDLKLRLQQDLVPRDQFVALYAPLVNTINDYGDKAVDLTKVAHGAGTSVVAIASEGHHAPQVSKTFDMAFYTASSTYRVGDLISFTLRSEQPCFLQVMDTDNHGQSIVLFPNAHFPNAQIEAHTTIQIPGPTVGGFQFRATEPGVERIVATCNASFQAIGASDLHGQDFKTFNNSRDAIASQSDAQQRYAGRLIGIEKTGGSGGSPSSGLVSNPLEPGVAITATKALILNIRSH